MLEISFSLTVIAKFFFLKMEKMPQVPSTEPVVVGHGKRMLLPGDVVDCERVGRKVDVHVRLSQALQDHLEEEKTVQPDELTL